MTNAVAVIGLTVGGTDVQQADFGIFLELVRGGPYEPAGVRGVDTVVPGLAGRIPRDRMGDSRVLELRGIVTGSGADEAAQRSDFADNALAFATLFDPTQDPVAVVATLPNGTTATINARTRPGVIVDLEDPIHATVSVEMESVDPNWQIA